MRRHASVLFVLITGLYLTACEEPQGSSDTAPPTAASTQPSTRRARPTTDLFAAVTQPATTQADDPLATPTRAITHLFELMSKEDIEGVRGVMVDPLPADKLRVEIRATADRLASGAKWEVVDSKISGTAALVIFRTTFPDGRVDVSPLVFVNRYDRWKVILGAVNLRRYTEGEKTNMNKVLEWAVPRLDELRGVKSATKPATAPPTTPSEPAP